MDFATDYNNAENYPCSFTPVDSGKIKIRRKAKMSKAQWIKENLNPGERYAGILLGKDGEPDQHVILLPEEGVVLTWQQAKDFAKKIGGELPTHREQSLLFSNLKEQFKPDWYWSSEQHAANSAYAWCQGFNDGLQGNNPTLIKLRARAVRRIDI